MDRCDVLIVGGGPAGSSCAWALREAGMDVVVMDRVRFPRDKTCAGWVTPQVLETLEIDAAHYAAAHVLQPIHGFAVCRRGNAVARVRRERVVSYGIRRCEFDAYLLERSRARLRLGEAVRDLRREGPGFVVNESIEASAIVGAGGHFCPVARWISGGTGSDPLIAAQEIEFQMSPDQAEKCPIDAEVPEIFFEPDLRGYGWVFRKGDHLNVGLGRQDPVRLQVHVAAFLRFLSSKGRLPPGSLERLHGHAYLLYGETRRPLVGRGALLIGDAAGLAHPRSGEGIRPAVDSGILAAHALLAERAGAGAAESAYPAALERLLGPRENAGGRGLTDWLPDAATRGLAGWLFGRPAFAGPVVVDRWFTRAHEPALDARAPGLAARR